MEPTQRSKQYITYIHSPTHFSALSQNSFFKHLWGKKSKQYVFIRYTFLMIWYPFSSKGMKYLGLKNFTNSKGVSISRNPRPLIPLGCKWILYSNSVFHYHREMFKWTDKKTSFPPSQLGQGNQSLIYGMVLPFEDLNKRGAESAKTIQNSLITPHFFLSPCGL